MKVLFIIIKYLTFPGALLRGFWEQLCCKASRVPVENKKYLQVNEMCGHIEHEMIRKPARSFWCAFVPGLMVFITGLLFFISPFINLFYLGIENSTMRIYMYVFLYISLSMFTSIFPSIEDAMVMWENYKRLNIALKIIFAPGAAIMYVGAFAERYCITFLTNAALAAVILLL